MSSAVYLHGVVATADRGYRVFSLRLRSRSLPFSQACLLVARRLAIDPNSLLTERLRIYRFEEEVDEDDARLLRGRDDPTALFRLSLLRESLRDVGEVLPRIGIKALHVLVRLPDAADEQAFEGLEALPPAYSVASGNEFPTLPSEQPGSRDTKSRLASESTATSPSEPEFPTASNARYPPRAQTVCS
ncbi:hypothetical protein HDU86_003661 [Geranomyces michiganensis]|nr:hypothetical protein HDU86_003661 [Geranomyces michiganensis]